VKSENESTNQRVQIEASQERQQEMTPEEMESTIQFILEQQAQFSVNMAKTEESISALSAAQSRTDETVSRLALEVEQLTTQVKQITVQVKQTSEQLEQNSRQQAHINEVVAVIADSQQHTDERLNALIDIVQGRNGQ
jgi:chromosome segregation ATPase